MADLRKDGSLAAAKRAATMVVLILPLLLARPLVAQERPATSASGAPDMPPPRALAEASAALDACARAAAAKDGAGARREADRADALAKSVPASHEAAALTVRAQVISRCRIPFANFFRQGALAGESTELLERALQLEPRHLTARFALALNHYYTPAFLGRTDDAIREFERLLQDHGEVDIAPIRIAYLLLGELYERLNRREDAVAVWRRGLERFPDASPLAEKLEAVTGAGGRAHESEGARLRTEPGVATSEPVYHLAPIVVEAGGFSVDDPRSATRLTKLDVYTTPGGAADVLQTFQTLPGVTQVTDGSDLYVRGGDPAEAPVFVDGVRLFYAGKFETLHGGLFGVLDPSALRRAYFSSGGFSARYGNALSGVLDLETEGRPAEPEFGGGANLAGVTASGRLPLGRRTGVWAGVRATETTPMLALHGRDDEFPSAPRAIEAMAALALEPRDGLAIRLSGLVEADRATARARALDYEGGFASSGASRLVAASARWIRADGRARFDAALGATERTTGFTFGVLDRERTDRGLTARLDGELAPAAVLRLRAGAEAARIDTREAGTEPVSEAVAPGSPATPVDASERHVDHIGGYIEAEARASRSLAVIAGARLDRLPGEAAWTGDPRLALAWRASHAWTVRLGAGVHRQGRWRMRYQLPDGGAPVGTPRRARHLVLGVQREGIFPLRAEAYIKVYDRFAAEPAATGSETLGPAATGRAVARGSARGVDVLLRFPAGFPIQGWASYSLLDADIELADGTRAPARYDVTHTATFVARMPLGTAWELGTTTRYATGRPVTPIVGWATGPDDASDARGTSTRPLYGPIHSERLPNHVRLDARLTRLVPAAWGMAVVYLEAINVLDRRNVMGYTYDAGSTTPRPIRSFFAERTLVLGTEIRF